MDFLIDFFEKLIRIIVSMTLYLFVSLISKHFGIKMPNVDEEKDFYEIKVNEFILTIYSKNSNIIVDAELWNSITDLESDEIKSVLKRLMVFNLKKMRELDEQISINSDSRKVVIRKVIDKDNIDQNSLIILFEDFLLNLSVINDMFFTTKEEKRADEFISGLIKS